MDHMRFNQRPNREPEKSEDIKIPVRAKNKGIFLAIFFVVIVLGALAYGLWYMYQKKSTFVVYDPTASSYYAVFLVNGQVYFGIPVSKNKDEFILTGVYYLQVSGADTPLTQQQSSGQKFALVKLGQELHGPTDQLVINLDNMLFYEQLRKDSKVVQSIESKN